MRDDLTPETLDVIASHGFDVYQSESLDWRTYAYFTDGENIGYIENNRLEGLTLSTVHIPNRTTGTGYGLRDDLRGKAILSREGLQTAFIHSPSWTNFRDLSNVRKWGSMENFLSSRGNIGRLVKVRDAKA